MSDIPICKICGAGKFSAHWAGTKLWVCPRRNDGVHPIEWGDNDNWLASTTATSFHTPRTSRT